MASVSGYQGTVAIPIAGATDIATSLVEWTLHHNIDEYEAFVKKQAFVETFFTAKEWDATIRFLVPAGIADVGGWPLLDHDGTDISCVFTWETTGPRKAVGLAQIDDFDLFDPRDGPVELTLHVIGTNSDGTGLVFTNA